MCIIKSSEKNMAVGMVCGKGGRRRRTEKLGSARANRHTRFFCKANEKTSVRSFVSLFGHNSPDTQQNTAFLSKFQTRH